MEKPPGRTKDSLKAQLAQRPKALWAAVAGVFVVGATYVGVASLGSEYVASGTTVAGRAIGGMSKSEATQVLSGVQHPKVSTPAQVSADGHSLTLKPGNAFHVDVEKTLSGRTGFNLSPASVWRHAFGGGEIEPTFMPDRAALQEQVTSAVQRSIPGSPQQGRVLFIGGKVVQRDGVAGRSVDVGKVTDQVAAGWPSKTSYTAPLTWVQPNVSTADLSAFAQGDARLAMSQPLVLKSATKSLTIQPSDVSDFISTDVSGRKPRIKVDSAGLEKFVASRTSDFITAPQDAKVQWTGGQAAVTASSDGRKLDMPKLTSAVEQALITDHEAQVPTLVDKAKVAEKDIDLAALPTTSMTKFTSAFPLGASQNSRIHNITTAARRIDGTVVMPGQQFSLLRTLGYSLTKERGYVAAGTLQNGMHIDGMGGGVSQISTVLYNTSFFAGVRLDEHTPHAVWISRYPMGREATLWNPSIDNTWTNDTGAPILIRATVAQGSVSMEFFGTKKYDVSTKTSQRYRITAPKHRVVRGVQGCESSSGSGVPGFSVDVWRTLSRNGQTPKTEKIHTTYAADDIITCG